MTWRALSQRLAATTVLVLLATTVSAQPARPAGAPPPIAPLTGTAQISGVVRNAADGTPIARARVSAVAETATEPHVTLSGADGKYALPALPAGSYSVTVTRTGFAPQTYSTGRSITATPILLAADQAVTTDFSLVPAGYISGRILDEDGTPFAGAVVEALVMRAQAGTDALFSISTSQTDDRGEFRLIGLPPGQYYVSAADPAFRAVSTPKGIVHYSATYHPGVSFADQARAVVVTDGAAAPRVEFRLKIVPPARVGGQLVASDGRQLFSAAIIMSPVDGEGAPMVAPEDPALLPDGTFSFGNVVPGHYQIRARGQTETMGAALFAVYSLTIDGQDVDGIQMMLRPGAVLDGRLIVDSTRGTRPPPLPTIRVRAPFIDGNSFGDALTGTVQPNGTFALRGLMKGSHQLVLDGLRPPWVLKSVTLRGSNITDQQFDVTEREQFRDVRITITDAPSEVSGVVQNARDVPVANTGVLIFPRAPLFWMRTNRRMRVAYTDRSGRFDVAGLPAGEYLAVASHALDESDLGRRDRLTTWETLATTFVLNADDGHASIKLLLVAPPGPAAAVR